MSLTELYRRPNSISLHDAVLLSCTIENKKMKLIYELGDYHYAINDALADIYKNPYEKCLYLVQEFDITEYIDIALDTTNLDGGSLSIGDNTLVGDDIMYFCFIPCGGMLFELKFRFSSFKWKYIGEYDIAYINNEAEKFRNCEPSILNEWLKE
ncbi:MAG: hypothetical protein R3Y23_01180 [Bacillota bacterium]